MADFHDDEMLLDWDSEIQSDGDELIILPEGDYVFEVTDFERGHFPGSEKIPPCYKAALTLKVKTEQGTAICKTDLILYRTLEWRISAFFRSIGQKKSGQRVVMNWNAVTGKRGRAHFKPRTYTNKYGEERQVNDVERFYDYNPDDFPDGWIDKTAAVEEMKDELPF